MQKPWDAAYNATGNRLAPQFSQCSKGGNALIAYLIVGLFFLNQ
jgi:hypothetical protein